MNSESKHVVNFRKSHLKAGEEIIAWGEGYIGEMMGKGDKTQQNGALIVTNVRVVFYRKGILGEVIESIPLDKLTSVERKSTMGHHTIRMHTSHDDLEFKTFDKQKLEALVQVIESRMAKANATSTESSSNNQHPLEVLKKLGELRDAGVITTEEFEAKKREILSRV